MFLMAFLIYCTAEADVCNITASNAIHKTEESCYDSLAYGIQYYESLGYVVPYYKCIELEGFDETDA